MREPVAVSIPRALELKRSMKILGTRTRCTPHLSRKLFHLWAGLLCFSLYAFVLNRSQAMVVLYTVGVPFVLLDFLRMRSVRLSLVVLRVMGPFMRREEIRSLSSSSYFLLGLMVILPLFPKTIVLMSCLFLAIGDPAAALIGTHLGKTRLFGKKTLEGSLGHFAVMLLCAYVFASVWLHLPIQRAWLVSVLCASISAIVELIPTQIDDNVVIPTVSAVLLSMVSHFLGLF